MSAPTEERLRNIKANMETAEQRVPLPQKAHDFPIQLVCYGPSLRGTWGQIDSRKYICTVSGAHDFLRDKGLTPTIHVEFDWRPHKAKHITNPTTTAFWLASCVSPELVAKIPNPSLWHAEQTVEESKLIRQRESQAFLVPGGSCAGLRAIEVLIAAGYRHFDIFGMDCSFDEKFGGWAGQHYGTRKADIIKLPIGGRTFLTSVPFMTYAEQFRYCKRLHSDCTFNLHGDGLLQHMLTMEKA